jgi:hypothetical protein
LARTDPLFVTHLCQSVFAVLCFLAMGPWMTVAALRVIKAPSHLEKRTIANWLLRATARHSGMMRGDVRFWAWVMLLEGISLDIVGALGLVATLVWVLRTAPG